MFVIITKDTKKWFFKHRDLWIEHNEYGPAYLSDVVKKYYQNGKTHNKLGPAIFWCDGIKSYYLNDRQYKYDKWLTKIKNNGN